jgi:hypothetical protein
MYTKWLENVNKNVLVKLVPTGGSRICSEHFSSDMKEEGGQRVILKPFAVPTIFSTSQVCYLTVFSIILLMSCKVYLCLCPEHFFVILSY